MVLSDASIRALASEGMIEPFDEAFLQPASYDLRLSHEFRVFDLASTTAVDLSDPSSFADLTRLVRVRPGERFVIHPGQFVLAATVEFLNLPDDVVARLEGKSSLARLALSVHATGGFIDPGFRGNVTLEMTNSLGAAIVLKPGSSIAQVSFMRMDAPAERPYAGRYQGDRGAVESRYGVLSPKAER